MTIQLYLIAVLMLAATPYGSGQRPMDAKGPYDSDEISAVPSSQVAVVSQPLFDFHESEIKFSLSSLMRTLRDGGHEGWVLAAYPDPKTKRPLIGAGFSLDVPQTEHPQRDPLNPHPFLEPSSAQLWQAAGLEPERLDRILDRYERDLKVWTVKGFRRKLKARALAPEVTEEEATRLLRVSAIQAIYNARAYCRGFDALSASQQMAMSQLVFQMGVNLEEFVQFLAVLNNDPGRAGLAGFDQPVVAAGTTDAPRWNAVQETLIASQWARLYTRRASTVIAMFDPEYSDDPSRAQARVNATLHPAVVRRRRRGHAGSVRVAEAPRKGNARSQRKHKVG